MRDCTFRAVTWGVYGYCYVHMVTGCVHYGYGDGSVSACRYLPAHCVRWCAIPRARITAYTVTRHDRSVAGGCVEPSVGSGPVLRAPGTIRITYVTNKNGRAALATLSLCDGPRGPGGPGALCSALGDDAWRTASGGSRGGRRKPPARATAGAAGSTKVTFIMIIQPPMNHVRS